MGKAQVPGAKKASGGSALKRLKSTLKDAGVIGKHQKISKRKSQTQRAAALAERKDARTIVRKLDVKARTNNPFELKINRQKHEILGRKVKGSVGRPGAVRKKGEEQRKKTLAVELDRKNKETAFVDRRFGENDPNMSIEDKMMQRFMKEKSKRSDYGSLFNLEDEDELTHLGRSLADEDAFKDAGLRRVDNDDDSDSGQIDQNTVKYSHFGGFSEDEGEEGEDGRKKSKNEVMKEIIAKSKMHKRERQLQKEQDEDLADEVDAQLDDIRNIFTQDNPRGRPLTWPDEQKPAAAKMAIVASITDADANTPVSANPSKPAVERNQGEREDTYGDYDQFVRELARERRAKPTDRLKTDEELALDEVKRLEKLERDRQRRMQGLPTEDEEKAVKAAESKAAKDAARSRRAQADDLGDDDYVAAVDEMVADEDEKPLTYQNGKLLNDQIFMRKRKRGSDEESSSEEDEEGSEEGDTDDDDEGSDEDDESSELDEEDSRDARIALAASLVEDADSEADDDDEEDNEGNQSDGSDAAGSWVMVSGSEKEDDHSDEEEQGKAGRKVRFSDTSAPAKQPDPTAAKELPYTFEAPGSHDDFLAYALGRTSEEQATIVQRLRVLYHVKLGGENRKKLQILLDVLYEHVQYLVSQSPPDLWSIDAISFHIIELSHQFPEQATDYFVTTLTDMHKRLQRELAGNTKRSGGMSSGDIVTLKCIGRIFSTSDLVHPVLTPAMLLMGEWLAFKPIKAVRDAAIGLILCEMLLEFQALSKRLVPEVVNYLSVLLALMLPISEEPIANSPVAPILNPGFDDIRISKWNREPMNLSLSQVLDSSEKVSSLDEKELKISLLHTVLRLLARIAKLYRELPSYGEIISPFLPVLRVISNEKLHPRLAETLTSLLSDLEASINTATLKRRPLLLQKFAPVAIQTYVPKFSTHYSVDRKARDPDKERNDKKKLAHEYKKEFKGAVRELRRDAAFVNRKRLEETKRKDVEYKKKMDKVMGHLAQQEGAMRGYERQMKKAKGKR
ncbi:nucleolar protein 14 [Gaertneriomyces semiglobifer]|nr:nucleolar protein 14 [Gaertneriomyces semiglobifer]